MKILRHGTSTCLSIWFDRRCMQSIAITVALSLYEFALFSDAMNNMDEQHIFYMTHKCKKHDEAGVSIITRPLCVPSEMQCIITNTRKAMNQGAHSEMWMHLEFENCERSKREKTLWRRCDTERYWQLIVHLAILCGISGCNSTSNTVLANKKMKASHLRLRQIGGRFSKVEGKQ